MKILRKKRGYNKLEKSFNLNEKNYSKVKNIQSKLIEKYI